MGTNDAAVRRRLAPWAERQAHGAATGRPARVVLATACTLLLAAGLVRSQLANSARTTRAAAILPAPARAGGSPPGAPARAPAVGAPRAPQGQPGTTADGPSPPDSVALAGCPVPPHPPGPPAPPPAHPSVVVPDSALPVPPPPAPRVANLAALTGKGMWIWQMSATDGGDVAAIVAAARAAGLHQLWVRVGDSFNGFYGAPFLSSLVPAAHRAGLAVIGWGFPYLDDPAGDAAWTRQALEWTGPGGARLDGWGADIETASEGVDLSARRATAYLGLVRPAMAGRPLVAVVYPPSAATEATYPYAAIAPFVDALAPMVYWECVQPAAAAARAIAALARLAPVHLIGQAYSMASEGGRPDAPSGAEITAFLSAALSGGALGASFWSWQAMDPEEWAALRSFRWSR